MGNCECGIDRLCGEKEINTNVINNEILTKQSKQSVKEELIPQLIASEKEIKQIYELILQIKTWQKESYSLFDYENQIKLKEQLMKINSTGFLFRRENQVHWIQSGEYQKVENDVLLFKVEYEDDNFQLKQQRFKRICKEQYQDEDQRDMKLDVTTKIVPPEKYNIDIDGINQPLESDNVMQNNMQLFEKGSKVWLVIRSIQINGNTNGIKLKTGDIIKMGRIKFKIRESNISNFKEKSHGEQEIIRQCSVASSDSLCSYGQSDICRICLSGSVKIDNPLINPCKCAGSMKYIHLQCLQTWLRQKLHSRHSENCIIFIWKTLECELCKFNYPPVFKSDNILYDLVELSKPKDAPYMVLEITQKKYEEYSQYQAQEDENSNGCNGVYIISFQTKKELRVGRAHETEIRINDISVSRQHAIMRMIGQEVYIQDFKSKFGTLLQVQYDVPLNETLNRVEFQVGRSVIQFQNTKLENQPITLNNCLRRNEPSIQDIDQQQLQ